MCDDRKGEIWCSGRSMIDNSEELFRIDELVNVEEIKEFINGGIWSILENKFDNKVINIRKLFDELEIK